MPYPEGVHRSDEWDCKVVGALAVISELQRFTEWVYVATPSGLTEFPFLAAWSRCFQLRQEASRTSAHLWSATHPSAHLQHPTLEAVLDLLVTISLLPPCAATWVHVSALSSTGASEPGFGVVRPSTFALEDSLRQSRRELPTAVAWDQLGITELHAGIGGLQHSGTCARCGRGIRR